MVGLPQLRVPLKPLAAWILGFMAIHFVNWIVVNLFELTASCSA